MNFETTINLHVCIREAFIRIAAEIEKKYEADNGHKKIND